MEFLGIGISVVFFGEVGFIEVIYSKKKVSQVGGGGGVRVWQKVFFGVEGRSWIKLMILYVLMKVSSIVIVFG